MAKKPSELRASREFIREAFHTSVEWCEVNMTSKIAPLVKLYDKVNIIQIACKFGFMITSKANLGCLFKKNLLHTCYVDASHKLKPLCSKNVPP